MRQEKTGKLLIRWLQSPGVNTSGGQLPDGTGNPSIVIANKVKHQPGTQIGLLKAVAKRKMRGHDISNAKIYPVEFSVFIRIVVILPSPTLWNPPSLRQ